ncbi:MAG TPA: hypothetical protein VGP79_04280 [Bryobacteraceae bacterium]|jgi:hypothetical protein|nr:hypothetical protein [Bryobacteraceae bacterium]
MPRRAAKALLAAVFALSVYRAITQSIVCDEAVTFELFIAAPLRAMFEHFDANHHFLNTVLMRLSISFFGLSDLSMRLPALGGALLYVTAVYRVTGIAFGAGWISLLAAAGLTLNPLVMDFLVAARGYGLALGLWMWALALLLGALPSPESKRRDLALAGAALALSVTANLVFVLPALALFGLTLVILLRKKPEADQPRKKRDKLKTTSAGPLWLWVITPVVGIALLYLAAAPVENMRSEHFYAGAESIASSLLSLATSSLQHSGPLRSQTWMTTWSQLVAYIVAPLILAVGLAFGILRRNRTLLLATGPAIFSALAIVTMHLLRGTPYPADRTGIYFLPLVIFVLCALTSERWLCVPAAALTAIFIVNFLTEINTRKFYVWEYDADTRSMVDYIAAHRPQRPDSQPVRVGGSWVFEPAIFYYGTKNNWTWMEVRRTPQPEAGCDFCLLRREDRGYVQLLGLKEVYRGPVSDSTLAIPSK